MGASLALVGLLVALVRRVFLERVSARRTLLLKAAAGGLSLLGFGLATAGWMVFAAMVVFGPWGLQGPAPLSLMSRGVSATEQGRLQGAVAGLNAPTDGTGPFLFGGLAPRQNPSSARLRAAGLA